jgi:hypothetical protein
VTNTASEIVRPWGRHNDIIADAYFSPVDITHNVVRIAGGGALRCARSRSDPSACAGCSAREGPRRASTVLWGPGLERRGVGRVTLPGVREMATGASLRGPAMCSRFDRCGGLGALPWSRPFRGTWRQLA